jgi:hypothetical protein
MQINYTEEEQNEAVKKSEELANKWLNQLSKPIKWGGDSTKIIPALAALLANADKEDLQQFEDCFEKISSEKVTSLLLLIDLNLPAQKPGTQWRDKKLQDRKTTPAQPRDKKENQEVPMDGATKPKFEKNYRPKHKDFCKFTRDLITEDGGIKNLNKKDVSDLQFYIPEFQQERYFFGSGEIFTLHKRGIDILKSKNAHEKKIALRKEATEVAELVYKDIINCVFKGDEKVILKIPKKPITPKKTLPDEQKKAEKKPAVATRKKLSALKWLIDLAILISAFCEISSKYSSRQKSTTIALSSNMEISKLLSTSNICYAAPTQDNQITVCPTRNPVPDSFVMDRIMWSEVEKADRQLCEEALSEYYKFHPNNLGNPTAEVIATKLKDCFDRNQNFDNAINAASGQLLTGKYSQANYYLNRAKKLALDEKQENEYKVYLVYAGSLEDAQVLIKNPQSETAQITKVYKLAITQYPAPEISYLLVFIDRALSNKERLTKLDVLLKKHPDYADAIRAREKVGKNIIFEERLFDANDAIEKTKKSIDDFLLTCDPVHLVAESVNTLKNNLSSAEKLYHETLVFFKDGIDRRPDYTDENEKIFDDGIKWLGKDIESVQIKLSSLVISARPVINSYNTP